MLNLKSLAVPRVLRAAGSFAIVLVAYWAYALVAVPLIEPPADPRQDEEISQSAREAAQQRVAHQVEALRGLFPRGAWQLKAPKILESDRFKLLFEDYRNLGDGRVELRPCTLIFTPDPSADEIRQKRQAVVLDVDRRERALLKFSEPLDLRRGKIGRLVEGELSGRITIRSKGNKPGPEDDLLIVTQNVQLTEHHVWTSQAVDFQWGPHYGRGHQMHLKLLPGDDKDRADLQEPNVAGVELFEVRRVEQLHLELGNVKLAPAETTNPTRNPLETRAADAHVAPGSKTAPGSPPATPLSDLPVEITCRGPFRFDVLDKVATFRDEVNVLRVNPNGPSDHLNCELLSISFIDRPAAEQDGPEDDNDGPKKAPAGSLDLRPARIEARGDPVVVFAPSQQTHARGKWLEYDLRTGRIVLDGGQEVMLRQGQNEIHARTLQYQSAGPGRLGRIAADGRGWLRGRMSDRAGEQLEAHWNDQLRVRPHEQNQAISLSGGAWLKYSGIGRLDAEEIHFWLWETQPEGTSGRSRLRPDRMLASGDVRVDSPELSSTVERMEVWFEEGKADGQTPTVKQGELKGQTQIGPARQGDRPPAADQPTETVYGLLPPAFPGPSTVYRPSSGPESPPPPAPKRHLEIVGRLLRARVLVYDDQRSELAELMLEESVHLAETQTAQAGQRPVLLSGDRLHVVDAHTPHAAATVSGRPGHFEGRGLALSGPNINLNRGTNRLWVDGPGQMKLPLDRDFEGRPLGNPGVLRVQWQDRMAFDGRTARFEGSVVAIAPNGCLQTETLEVQLKRAIRFSDPQIQADAEVEQILCRGGVLMESRTFEQQGLSSHERMQVLDLAINLNSGALTAGGPGWLRSIRRGSYDLVNAGEAPSPVASVEPASQSGQADRTVPAPKPDKTQLWCLRVQFQGSVTGNLHGREMSFHDQVRAAYAPVDSWQATLKVDDPDALGERGVLMRCDRLSVAEMPGPADGRRTLELEAAGNAVIEGNAFTAWATRMTYAQAKGLLVLEGDGRTDAQLFRQQQVGGPTSKFAARKIYYWPKTKRLKIDGARSLELNQLPSEDTGKR